MSTFVLSVLHGDDGLYMGKLTIYSDGVRCCSQVSGIKRLTKEDALLDAEWMENDLLQSSSKV